RSLRRAAAVCGGALWVTPPRPPAVGGAGDVVPTHVPGDGNVPLRIGAPPLDGQLQPPALGGAEVLDDLRARPAPAAAVEDAPPGQITDVVLVVRPPLRALAPGLVELEHAVRLRPAEVQGDSAPGGDRPRAVP